MIKIDKESIKEFYLQNQNKDVRYHTWEHCESVAKRALMLAGLLGVSDKQKKKISPRLLIYSLSIVQRLRSIILKMFHLLLFLLLRRLSILTIPLTTC